MAVAFRPLRAEDLAVLETWLSTPHVQRWWPERSDAQRIRATYLPAIEGDDPTEMFVVVLDGADVGLIQRYALSDYPAWATAVSAGAAIAGAVGIDYLVGVPELLGTGVGTQMIDEFSAATFAELEGATSIVVAVQQENVASWRALEGAAYSRVWAGTLDSDDPSDAGPAYVYVRVRDAG